MSDNPAYSHFVASLVKPGQEIIDELTPVKAHALHMALGLQSDAGEVADAVKKHVIYNKAIDLVHLKEELGDVEFFLEGLRQAYGISRTEVIMANMDKLQKRYAQGKYSNQAAQERRDKQ
jgi:NTP pyrophosphatase (non-canonical NTP hydrolase)